MTLLIATVWLCVVLSEIGLRLFLPLSVDEMQTMNLWGPSLGYKYDPALGWSPVSGSREWPYRGRLVNVTHNSRGLRDPEPMFDARPGVLFLGDSFVWGYNVEAAERFTELLRARHPEWQVHNFGVCGYSTDQEYMLLQKHFNTYRPRVVFLVFCSENDEISNCSNRCGDWYFKPYFVAGPKGLALHGTPVPRSERVFCLQHPTLARSYLARLAVRAWGNLHRPPPPGADPTTALLEALRSYVADRGGVFCVGLTHSAPQVEQFLQRASIPCLDLTTELRFKGDGHWTPEGHAFVAGKIEAFLLSHPLLSANLNPTKQDAELPRQPGPP